MGKNIAYVFMIGVFVLFINSCSAISISSGNYSVGMAGTGLAVANTSSTNYGANSLLFNGGTTRNAENGQVNVNVGFYNGTEPHQSLQIKSYTIYPRSAVNGSIIRLSVSAVYFDSVWAVLSLPNGSSERVDLINDGNTYYVAGQVGTYSVTFYANNSQGHLTSAVDSFVITSPASETPPSNPPSGGGGGTTICTYTIEYGSWSVCDNQIQTRIVNKKNSCTGAVETEIEEMNCSAALFDTAIRLQNLVLTGNETLKFGVSLLETKGIEKIDVNIKYTIFDSDGNEIFNQFETKAIKGNLSYEKEFKELKLKEGSYKLRVDIIYGDSQKAFAEQTFEVKQGGITLTETKAPEIGEGINYEKILAVGGWVIGIILSLSILFVIIKLIRKIDFGRKTPSSNSVFYLIDKKVYSDGGMYVGKVDDVGICGNKIDTLSIIVDDKFEFKSKGIIVEYTFVKSVGDVVIVEDKVVEKISEKS